VAGAEAAGKFVEGEPKVGGSGHREDGSGGTAGTRSSGERRGKRQRNPLIQDSDVQRRLYQGRPGGP
jgi:hypothetical protein